MTELDETFPSSLPLAEDPAYRDVISFMVGVYRQRGRTRRKNELLVDEILDNNTDLIVAVKTIAAEELAAQGGRPSLSAESGDQTMRRKKRSELGSTKPTGLARALGSAGMEQVGITNNSHRTFRNPENGQITRIGSHRREIGPAYIGSMLSQLGLSRERYLHSS